VAAPRRSKKRAPIPRDKDRGKRIKDARERPEIDLAQSDVAEKMGVDVGTISRWERGFPVKPRDIAALAAALGVPPSEIDPVAAKTLGENVPRETSNGARMAWERAVNTEPIEDWLEEFRKRLRKVQMPQEQRDDAVRAVRRAGLGYSVGGSFQDWTIEEALQLMETVGRALIETYEEMRKRQ
jgi:transcriptional regulator with XRE-family HTH domain